MRKRSSWPVSEDNRKEELHADAEPKKVFPQLLRNMNLGWTTLICLLCLLGVSSSEAELGEDSKSSAYLINALHITRHLDCFSPSASLCILSCSTKNVQGAILSWYNETQVCSKITVDDLNPTISLQLYVKYQDRNNYSCVFNSSMGNQIQVINTAQYCEPCPAISKTQLPVKLGNNFTLYTESKDIQGFQVFWLFGPKKTVIAEILKNKVSLCDLPDQRFRDRLNVNVQTGDLTVTNATKAHSGVYKLHINNVTSICWSFNVSVHDNLPTPQISSDSNHCPLSVAKCVLECSVMNVSQVNLTWYRAQTSLSSIVVSDHLNYVCLNVDPEDKNNYSCVVSNSFINETKYAIICELCSGKESEIRLIIGLCVGVGVPVLVALIALIVFVVFTRKNKLRRQKETGSESETSRNSSPVIPEPTDDNAANQNLIASSSSTNASQESIPLHKRCFKN